MATAPAAGRRWSGDVLEGLWAEISARSTHQAYPLKPEDYRARFIQLFIWYFSQKVPKNGVLIFCLNKYFFLTRLRNFGKN